MVIEQSFSLNFEVGHDNWQLHDTDHVSTACCWQSVESPPDAVDGDHVQVLAARVVRAVHHRPDWTRQRDAELSSSCSSTS